MADKKENIVLFPFMAQGHIIPYLAFALRIEEKTNYTINLINTPLNIKKLKPSLPPQSSINLLEIPFSPSDFCLPLDGENTDTLPYDLIIRLIKASTSLKPCFKQIIKQLSPLCIFADIFFGWTGDIAKELGVFHTIYSVSSGFGIACYHSLWLNLPHLKVSSDEFFLPDFEQPVRIHRTQLPATIAQANGADDWSVFQKENLSSWENSNGILINTLEEFDQQGLLYFKQKFDKMQVWAIGPMILSLDSQIQRGGKEGGIALESCLQWLDNKPDNSVLYIVFGSNNTISSSQMMQLATALEISCKNFIWVVRPPIGYDINSEFKAQEWLPRGFEERVVTDSKRGLLVYNWAPQIDILSHRAVSAFLTHGGWNSVLEALSQGLPLIGWPMAADHFSNVKLLEEELGVCVEVARGMSCEVKCEDLAKKIEMVMDEKMEEGREMRNKACKVKEMILNALRDEEGYRGSSVKALDDIFSAAKLFKAKNYQVTK